MLEIFIKKKYKNAKNNIFVNFAISLAYKAEYAPKNKINTGLNNFNIAFHRDNPLIS